MTGNFDKLKASEECLKLVKGYEEAITFLWPVFSDKTRERFINNSQQLQFTLDKNQPDIFYQKLSSGQERLGDFYADSTSKLDKDKQELSLRAAVTYYQQAIESLKHCGSDHASKIIKLELSVIHAFHRMMDLKINQRRHATCLLTFSKQSRLKERYQNSKPEYYIELLDGLLQAAIVLQSKSAQHYAREIMRKAEGIEVSEQTDFMKDVLAKARHCLKPQKATVLISSACSESPSSPCNKRPYVNNSVILFNADTTLRRKKPRISQAESEPPECLFALLKRMPELDRLEAREFIDLMAYSAIALVEHAKKVEASNGDVLYSTALKLISHAESALSEINHTSSRVGQILQLKQSIEKKNRAHSTTGGADTSTYPFKSGQMILEQAFNALSPKLIQEPVLTKALYQQLQSKLEICFQTRREVMSVSVHCPAV